MSEKLLPPTHEISEEQKKLFIDHTFSAVPYNGQEIDDYGCYSTYFPHERGEVRVTVPAVPEIADSDEWKFMDDAVRLVVSEQEVLPDGREIHLNRTYKIHLEDGEAAYDETTHVYDAEGNRIRPAVPTSIEEMMEAYRMKLQLVDGTFSVQRLLEAMAVLDTVRGSE